MKGKGLKLTLYILIVVLISLISFFGIYVKDSSRISNIVNEYMLGSNLKGKAVMELKVDDTKNEVVYDENGQVVEEPDDENKDKYTTVEEPVNKEEVLNVENFEKSKNIIEERFKFIKLPDYNIRLNKSNGTIIIEADEGYMQDVSTMTSIIGKLEAKDTDSDELLFNNSNIKSVNATYQTDMEGATTVYLDITFNNDSKSKIDELKNKYTVVEEKNEETENTVNNETSEDETQTETEEDKEDVKTITLNFDGSLLNEAEFGDIIITNSTMRIPVANSSTNSSTINSYYNTAILIAHSINIGELPIVYTVEATEYFAANYGNVIEYIIIGLIVAVAVIYVYMIIKYKSKGVIGAISYTLWIALLLLAIRYTNIEITISSLLSFIVLILINAYITNAVIDASMENTDYTAILKNSYKKIVNLLIISIIILVVFSFTTFGLINSIGLLMVWGVLISVLNSLITAMILSIK